MSDVMVGSRSSGISAFHHSFSVESVQSWLRLRPTEIVNSERAHSRVAFASVIQGRYVRPRLQEPKSGQRQAK